MLGVVLVLALLTGAAAMLTVRLLPAQWSGLVVLAGMGGAGAAALLLALARWRAGRLETDYRQAPARVVGRQGRAFRLYFLAGGLMPAFLLSIMSGVLLLLLGAGNAAAAFLGAVAGAGIIALAGGLQGLLRPSATRGTMALCWKRLPRAEGVAGSSPVAALSRTWRLLRSSLLITSRYRGAADADLRSSRPVLPALTRVLDRQRTGGGGRPPRLVTAGWVWPARDLLQRTLAVSATVLLLFPLLWLAAGLLPDLGALGMGEQMRRLAYSRQGSGPTPPGSSSDSPGPQGGGDGSGQQAGQSGRSGADGAPSDGQDSGQGGSGQTSGQDGQSPDGGSDPAASPSDGSSGQGDAPEQDSASPEASRGDGQAGSQEGQGVGSGGQGDSGKRPPEGQGDGQGRGSTSGEGASGQSESAGESGPEGYGRSGGDPEMDFRQPLVEVPELNPHEAVELDLPPLQEARSDEQPSSQEGGRDRPQAAVSRDRAASAESRPPAAESSSQRLPNWIRALWDRISPSSGDSPPSSRRPPQRKENP